MGRIKRTAEMIALDIKQQSKECCVCNTRKPFTEFFNFKNKSDGKSYRCKMCDGLARAAWKERNPERSHISQRNNNLKTKYGVDLSWYTDKMEEQDYGCAICEVKENKVMSGPVRELNFAVDHDHETGAARGLLCSKCNRGLGFFGDNSDLLRKAAMYLDQHNATTE